MKEIIAVIRPDKWRQTVDALHQLGIETIVQQRVLGRGRQAGLRYLSHTEGPGMIRYLPKQLLRLYAEDSQLEAAIERIAAINRTGVIGDGKIFVSACEVGNCAPAVEEQPA